MNLFKKKNENKEIIINATEQESKKNSSKTKSRILIAALALSLIANFGLASSYNDSTQYEEKYQVAQEQVTQLTDTNEKEYDKGHTDGYDEGKKAGYKKGKKEGYDKGYDEAKEEYAVAPASYDEDSSSGYSDGSTSSYDSSASSDNSSSDNYTEQTVYITDTGGKYHNYGCQYLSQSCHSISLSNAQAQGYSSCSRCF